MIHTYFLIVVLSFEAVSADMIKGICTTPYHENGICIQVSKCPFILSAFDTNPGEAIKFLSDSKCGCDAGKVCCGSSIKKPHPQQLTCGPSLKQNINIARISDPTICGLDISNTGRIQGGEVADFGEFPWLAAIETESKLKKNSAGIRCGGSIISNRYILTAAHCIAHHEFVATRVWLGVTNIGPEGNCLSITGYPKCIDSIEKVNVQKIIPHPNYQSNDKINDIGLVRVDSFEYSEYIRPICLPVQGAAIPITGTYMAVAGWGAMEQEGVGSSIKLKVNLPLQMNGMCNRFLEKAISDEQLCVGGDNGKDSCQGDSGGPLMNDFINTNGEIQWYQEGIVSYGYGCGHKGRPAIYTRVSSHVKWITSAMTIK